MRNYAHRRQAIAQLPTAHQDRVATRSPLPDDAARAAQLVDALGVAWITFRLYSDPRGDRGFRQAGGHPGHGPCLPVAGGGAARRLRVEPPTGGGAPAVRAVGRLAAGSLLPGIGALGFTSPPTPNDVLALLEIIRGEPARTGITPLQASPRARRGAVLLVEHGTLGGRSRRPGATGRTAALAVEHSSYRAGQLPEGPGEGADTGVEGPSSTDTSGNTGTSTRA